MGKREWKYALILAGVFLLFVGIEVFGPKPINWTVTFHSKDKNPFGNYLMQQQFQDIFGDQPVQSSFTTLYEFTENQKALNEVAYQVHDQHEVITGIDQPINHLILTNTIRTSHEDMRVLLERIALGEDLLISTEYLTGLLADTLKAYMRDNLFAGKNLVKQLNTDTVFLRFSDDLYPQLREEYPYLAKHARNHIKLPDSLNHKVLATNHFGFPITVYIPWGKGRIFLNSTPLAFTNFYLLETPNEQFVSGTLSLLNPRPLLWSEYYQMGRMESQTPLRFILNNDPLKWAYYISILSLLMFIIFEAKRKQRIIPVVRPLENHSLQFVKTIGQLYLNRGQHKKIAEKKITFFLERIRTRYFLSTEKINQDFFRQLAKKTGKSPSNIETLFSLITRITNAREVSEEQLMTLSKAIEEFEHPA
jgi:hypothetical protein